MSQIIPIIARKKIVGLTCIYCNITYTRNAGSMDMSRVKISSICAASSPFQINGTFLKSWHIYRNIISYPCDQILINMMQSMPNVHQQQISEVFRRIPIVHELIDPEPSNSVWSITCILHTATTLAMYGINIITHYNNRPLNNVC